jgi:tetratricopeptide (TPR) repeat protein
LAGCEQAAGGESQASVVTMDKVRAHLAGQSKDALVDLLVAQAMGDERLRRRLLLEASRPVAPGVVSAAGASVASMRAWIEEAARISDYLDDDEVDDYVAGLEDVVDALERLLEDGHAVAVVELVEYAVDVVESSIGYIDDSGGDAEGVLGRLAELHLAACERADLDPVVLAKRLFVRELNGQSDTFFGALHGYAEVLGPEGLAAYRKLAEAEWEWMAPRTGNADRYTLDHRRWRIAHMMETLARVEGDVDALVAVIARDLAHAYAYLRIAEVLREAGRDDEALGWAERGMAAFPEPRADSRLREFLAEQYHQRGRHDDAVALYWQAFSGAPSLASYQALRGQVERARQWPAWRERALTRLREHVAASREGRGVDHWAVMGRDHSELVRVLLWEGDVEAAWAEARAGGCAQGLWLELADRRAAQHPEEALPVYQRAVEGLLAHTGNDVYERVVQLLRKLQELLGRLGREAEFAGQIASIRATQRRKRNLMKLLDAAGW